MKKNEKSCGREGLHLTTKDTMTTKKTEGGRKEA
jgi:hypothetical protein